MDRLIKSIDKQIEFNKGKNIFLDESALFKFLDDTVNAISNLDSLDYNSETILIDYATDKVLGEFCRVNQYYSFNSESKLELRSIYVDLFASIRQKKSLPGSISAVHYQRLKDWLLKYNSFAGKVYAKAESIVETVPCSEYSPKLQLEILHIDANCLLLPVLDVGCGKQAKLVSYLEQQGIEVCGIDRFPFASGNLQTADWLEYNYGIRKWGTIISHLGFSNHFKHHNLRDDGDYIGYAKAFMNILNSLKVGGSFHYAPNLPFIEKYLDPVQYLLAEYEIEGSDFKSTVVKRLK
jgi:hypothetical protein